MVKIDITDESADKLFTDILVQDYQALLGDIAKLSALPYREPWQQEDLDTNRRVVAAMVELLSWYLPYERYKALMVSSC
jgi:hypothetical protein